MPEAWPPRDELRCAQRRHGCHEVTPGGATNGRHCRYTPSGILAPTTITETVEDSRHGLNRWRPSTTFPVRRDLEKYKVLLTTKREGRVAFTFPHSGGPKMQF